MASDTACAEPANTLGARGTKTRRLPDGCANCGHSRNYCDCVHHLDNTPCCGACTH